MDKEKMAAAKLQLHDGRGFEISLPGVSKLLQ